MALTPLLLLLFAGNAHAGAFVQVGTGVRPLSLPGTALTFGGGARLGASVDRFTPFAGATVTWASLEVDDVPLSSTIWSVLAGARFDFTPPDRLARPFVSAGALFGATGAQGGQEGEEVALDVGLGPGGFAGFGADAALSPGVAVGVEVGLALTAGEIVARVEEESERISGFATWSYVDLHLVLRPGKSK